MGLRVPVQRIKQVVNVLVGDDSQVFVWVLGPRDMVLVVGSMGGCGRLVVTVAIFGQDVTNTGWMMVVSGLVIELKRVVDLVGH